MKRKDINIYQLTHTHNEDGEDLFVHTEMPEDELLKLIKVIQNKAFNIGEYDLFPEEMQEVLMHYDGIRTFPMEEDFIEFKKQGKEDFDYIEHDLYMIGEATNIKVSDEDLNNPKYNNEYALRVLNNIIREGLC